MHQSVVPAYLQFFAAYKDLQWHRTLGPMARLVLVDVLKKRAFPSINLPNSSASRAIPSSDIFELVTIPN
jgi:hypothetical protein